MSNKNANPSDPAREKKVDKLIFRIFLLVLIAYVAFYIWHTYKAQTKPKFSADYKFGVIQTTEDENISYITYYNKDMKKGYTQKIQNGQVGDSFEAPQVNSQNVYMLAKGKKDSANEEKIIAVNTKTSKKTSYNVKQTGITNYRVDSKHIYTAATTNSELVISQYTKSSKKTKEVNLKDVTLDCFKVYNEKLYVIVTPVTDKKATKSMLKIIDTKTMKEISSIDLSIYPGKKTDLALVNTELYFTYQPIEGSQNSTGGLGIYNLVTKKVEKADISLDQPDQLFNSNNKFIVSSYSNNKVSVLDYVNGTTKTYELETTPKLSKVTDTYFYYMDDSKVYRYKIYDFSFDKSVEVPIKSSDNATFHLSSLFIK